MSDLQPSAADVDRYRALNREALAGAAVIACALALLSLPFDRLAALAALTGGVCGELNALVLMRAGERFIGSQRKGAFVISSFSRVVLFGIVPVAFGVRGPWWTMVLYYAAFFTPTVIYALRAQRT